MTDDRTPLQELKDSLRGKDGPRARAIKAIWSIACQGMPEGALDGGPGRIMAYPDPDSPLDDLIFEKIIYDGGTVIECEGVVLCRLK